MISSANGPSVCIGIFFKCSQVPVKTFRALCLPTGDNTAFGLPSEVIVDLLPARNQFQQPPRAWPWPRGREWKAQRRQRNGFAQFHHLRFDFRVFECLLVFMASM